MRGVGNCSPQGLAILRRYNVPLAVDNLTEQSSPEQIQEAISKSIEKCMGEGGKTQKECAGQAYGIARRQTGKPLNAGR